MGFKIGDRIILDSSGIKEPGVIINSNDYVDTTYQVRWDFKANNSDFTSWVTSTDIVLDTQRIRNDKIEKILKMI